MADETKNLIDRHVARMGHTVREWRDDPDNGLTAVLGQFRVIDGDEDTGLYEGDEGELTASKVGSEKYGNVNVCYSFTPEGYDGGNDVRDLDSLEEVG
jgi:hypothetical protein